MYGENLRKMKLQNQNSYKGLTKKEHKRKFGSSTPGIAKVETCRATGLDKALIKYPRARKVMPDLFNSCNQKKDKASGRT